MDGHTRTGFRALGLGFVFTDAERPPDIVRGRSSALPAAPRSPQWQPESQKGCGVPIFLGFRRAARRRSSTGDGDEDPRHGGKKGSGGRGGGGRTTAGRTAGGGLGGSGGLGAGGLAFAGSGCPALPGPSLAPPPCPASKGGTGGSASRLFRSARRFFLLHFFFPWLLLQYFYLSVRPKTNDAAKDSGAAAGFFMIFSSPSLAVALTLQCL